MLENAQFTLVNEQIAGKRNKKNGVFLQRLSKPVFLVMVLVTLASCNNGNIKVIERFEKEHHQVKITEFVSIGDMKPFYAKDSVSIIMKKYNVELNKKLASLNQYYYIRDSVRQQTINELDDITNEKMAKVVKNRIALIDEELVQVERIIKKYKNSPDSTGFQQLIDLSGYYQLNADSLLGYVLNVQFNGKEGQLPESTFHRKYFLPVHKKQIICLMKKP